MYRNIVIGFDGTEHSRDAVALGVALARATGASVTLVTAFYDIPEVLPDPLRGQLLKDAEHSLIELGLELPADLVAAKHLVTHRSPARALFELAEEKAADLVVLGSSRQAVPGQMTCGRLARQVIDGAPCAVVIAPAGFRERGDTTLDCIGVGVDGGDESDQALAVAGELAHAFEARLLVMAAVEPVIPVLSHYGFEAEKLAAQEREASATSALQRAVESAPSDVTVDQARLQAKPAALALAEHAAAADVDLLVVGARGFGPVRRVLLGSVSAELMRKLPCALMVVPRGAGDEVQGATAAAETLEA